MKRMKKRRKRRLFQFTAGMLCLCMMMSVVAGADLFLPNAYAEDEDAESEVGATDSDIIVENSRIADPNTMDTYQDALLSDENGSRYAGRVWTDKTVFAYDASKDKGGTDNNQIKLDMKTDGYEGSVGFNADFGHVFSALTSTQVVNEYPQNPIDLVITFDMSGSMGQDTRYGIDPGNNSYQSATGKDDEGNAYPENGVSMADRIKNSRVQKTLDAINKTIDNLMEQNPQNRVAVCGYGANATVLMPLAHWKGYDKNSDGVTDYLSVGGMETLYHPSDLQAKDIDGDGKYEWYWMNNRDTCYTVVVNGTYNKTTTSEFNNELNDEDKWKKHTRTVSNNVCSTNVKAFPGVEMQTEEELHVSAKRNALVTKIMRTSEEAFKAGTALLKGVMSGTKELEADEYVGYFTNTQGGIYLAYKQLADDGTTTYTDKLTYNGQIVTVPRVPAAIIMSDGGANFAFNPMGTVNRNDGSKYDGDEKLSLDAQNTTVTYYNYDDWKREFGKLVDKKTDGIGKPVKDYEFDQDGRFDVLDKYYRLYQPGAKEETGKYGNIGDEWYKVWLPGEDEFKNNVNDNNPFKGLPSIFNKGADIEHDGTLSTPPEWYHKGVLYSRDNNLDGTPGTVLEVLLTASYMSTVVEKHYRSGWTSNNITNSRRPDGKVLSTYTMNVDSEHVPQWGRWRLYPTLDPKEYSLDDLENANQEGDKSWAADTKKFGEKYDGDDFGTTGNKYRHPTFGGLYNTWITFKNGPADASMADNGNIRIKIDKLPDSGYTQNWGGTEVAITNKDVIENIAYNDQFFDVTSKGLSGTFEDIFSLITGQVFTPVSGVNDSGAKDSVTYQDPIGDYMEIKNQSITVSSENRSDASDGTTYDMSMLLFGEMHGLVRTAVYDFQWNDEWMKTHGKDVGKNEFPRGWYKGDAGKAQAVNSEQDDRLPQDCENAESAWQKGWVYRLGYKDLLDYVPISEGNADADTPPANLPEQIKRTTYTIYCFKDDENNRAKLCMNPVYGEKVPDDLQARWDAASKQDKRDNSLYENTPGVYRLSDIRVWGEEYGGYEDTVGAITPNHKAYEASMYVNIPTAALPTQLADITLGPDGVLSYKTNLGEKTTMYTDPSVLRSGLAGRTHSAGQKRQTARSKYQEALG